MAESQNEILKLFDDWSAALKTGSPDEMVALYAPDAVLVPTRSNEVRDSHRKIRDYFVEFLKYMPTGRLDEPYLRTYGGTLAANSGLYTFHFAAAPGGPQTVRARYTFVYQRAGTRWLIAQHHSSVLYVPSKESPGLLEVLF